MDDSCLCLLFFLLFLGYKTHLGVGHSEILCEDQEDQSKNVKVFFASWKVFTKSTNIPCQKNMDMKYGHQGILKVTPITSAY